MRHTILGFEYNKAKRKKQTYGDLKVKNMCKVPVYSPPPTEAQLELIETLKKKLEDNGHDTSFLAEPSDKNVAWHVCNALVRMCKKYNLPRENNNA